MPIKIGKITLYSLVELSRKFKVSIKTLRTYLKTGKLKGQKVGGKWYVSEDAIDVFFREGHKLD